MTAALLLLAIAASPPTAPPFAAHIAPPFSAIKATPTADARAGAIRYTTAGGETVSIVPEPPIVEDVAETVMVSMCGMGCCLAPRTVRRRVTINGPTPFEQIETGLALLELDADSILYDLGSGDGRVCVLASKLYGCRSVGLDLRSAAVELAKRNAKANGVEHLTRFYTADADAANLEQATALYAHLPKSAAPILARALDRFRQIRYAASYQHAPPGARWRKIGAFFLRSPRAPGKP